MSIKDDANIFAEAVKKCPEVIQLQEANKILMANDACKKMLDEFRVVQVEAYNEKMQKGDVTPATKEKFTKFTKLMIENPDFGNYLMAEQKFGPVWEEIMAIINGAVGLSSGSK